MSKSKKTDEFVEIDAEIAETREKLSRLRAMRRRRMGEPTIGYLILGAMRNIGHPATPGLIARLLGQEGTPVRYTAGHMGPLETRGLVRRVCRGVYELTDAGYDLLDA